MFLKCLCRYIEGTILYGVFTRELYCLFEAALLCILNFNVIDSCLTVIINTCTYSRQMSLGLPKLHNPLFRYLNNST